MKVNYRTLLAAATIVLLSAAATRAEESAGSALAMDANTAPAAKAQTATTAQVATVSGDTATYCQECDPVRDFILRAGAWGTHASGSPNKVGEYQSLQPSPFWDADGIFSDGDRTVDVTATGTDNDTTDGRLHFYGGKWLQADLGYERFDHELDAHQFNFRGWNYLGQNNTTDTRGGTASNTYIFYSEDNKAPGQDYAIRVQEYKANFKGNLTENLKWRVNVFGIDKEGYRQANAFTHCSSSAANGSTAGSGALGNVGSQCHVVSQSQHIDWQTTEVTPSLELRLGCDAAIEYSHVIREFRQNDQPMTYNYATGVSSVSLNPGSNGAAATAGYGIVPNSETQIDRLKFSTKIGCDTDAYLLGYVGYNEDQLRTTYRNFNGGDLRITNKSIDTLTLTARGKYYREDSTTPLTTLNAQYPSMANYYQEANLNAIGPQINRETHAFGLDGRWRPFQDECDTFRGRMAFTGGYEYSTLIRENAGDTIAAGGPGTFVDAAGNFVQPNSNKNTVTVGVEEKWSSKFNTYLRYKYISTEYPLYGITPDVNSSINNALNSSLPTQENRVELGCTWTPTDCLMVNATLFVENAMSDAPYVNWQSNSLPFVLSAWWAPTQDWSFSAGASEMDSWLNQDVAVSTISPSGTAPAGISIPWKYIGVADVFNLGTRYAATEKLSFTGDFEYVHGINSSYGAYAGAGANNTVDLGQYSLVKMQSFRLGAGVDYRLRPRVTTYARYNYYDYQDISSGLTSGQVHMILGGMSALF